MSEFAHMGPEQGGGGWRSGHLVSGTQSQTPWIDRNIKKILNQKGYRGKVGVRDHRV